MRELSPADGAATTQEEADTCIAGVYKELVGQEPGTYCNYVGSDIFIYGTVEADNKVVLYHCKILRVSTSVDDAEPEEQVKLTGAAPAGKS